MSQTTTQTALEPSDHPAWTNAQGAEDLTAALALSLAEQVCMVIPERDWLLTTCGSDARILEQVWQPAVAAMYAWWIEDLDPERGASGEQTTARREAFAALAACAGQVAWACGEFSLAAVLAHRSRTTAPRARSIVLADLVSAGAYLRCQWGEVAAEARRDCRLALVAHRQGLA